MERKENASHPIKVFNSQLCAQADCHWLPKHEQSSQKTYSYSLKGHGVWCCLLWHFISGWALARGHKAIKGLEESNPNTPVHLDQLPVCWRYRYVCVPWSKVDRPYVFCRIVSGVVTYSRLLPLTHNADPKLHFKYNLVLQWKWLCHC